MRSLENYSKIPNTEEISNISGIIVLGGFTSSGMISKTRNAPQLNKSSERFFMALSIHKKFPKIPVWFTGFSGSLKHQGWSEGKTIKMLLKELKYENGPFYFEEQSRNTYENITFSKKLISPKKNEKWLLITSAVHMYRAHLCFKAANWDNIILYPVDFNTTPKGTDLKFNFGGNHEMVQQSLHEYIGLLAYKLTGKI